MGLGLELRPNVVLLHAGTNDLNRPESANESWADAPKRLGSVIDNVLKVCPDAVVIVAKIIQAENVQTANNLKTFNEAIPSVVRERVRKGSKVTVVDESVVGADELVDKLHPYVQYSWSWIENTSLTIIGLTLDTLTWAISGSKASRQRASRDSSRRLHERV